MTNKPEKRAWFEIKELSDSYENAIRIAKKLAKGSWISEPMNFEEAFAECLSDQLDMKFGPLWLLKPTIVHYSVIMSNDALEEFLNENEPEDLREYHE